MRDSKKYELNKNDIMSMSKVIGFSILSTVVASLITLIPQVEIPAEYAVIGGIFVNIINTLLIFLRNWLADNQPNA